jgi:hypothetical protein
MDPAIMEFPIYWKIAGKLEYQTEELYVGQDKLRTFIISDFELLFHQLRLYKKQNESMKNFYFSAYGFNPYVGGTNRLAVKHCKRKRIWSCDGKAWDRKINVLRQVYEIRNTFAEYDPFLEWVTTNTIVTNIILPNGDVILKSWGNNSGSGNTTCDNIIAMHIILFDIMYRIFVHMGMKPTFETLGTIIKNYIDVDNFGDDVLGSDDLPISDELFEKFVREGFSRYGIILDPFIITNNIEAHSFLGFGFTSINGIYYPLYSKERIAISAITAMETVGDEETVSKLYSLMLMSAPQIELFENLRAMLVSMCDNINCNMAISLRNTGVPHRDHVLRWIAGYEGHSLPFNEKLSISFF